MTPYVLVSCAVSLDGQLDDRSPDRLLLSGPEDFDQVDEVRTGCDALLVGAGTVRRDDPRLLVRSAARRAARAATGRPPTPARVVLSRGGDLDPGAALFRADAAAPLVYVGTPALDRARRRLGPVATVLDAGDPPGLPRVLADLAGRGVRRLLVEGGAEVLRAALDRADELRLAVTPVLVGDPSAPRLTGPDGGRPDRLRLLSTELAGDVVVLRYALSPRATGDPA